MYDCNIFSFTVLMRVKLSQDDRGLGVRFPVAVKDFPLRHIAHNGSGTYSAFYNIGTRESFPGGKVAGA
jgi:hypothetical protein